MQRTHVPGLARAAAAVFAAMVVGLVAATTCFADAKSDCFSPDQGRRIDGCTRLLDEPLTPLRASLVYATRALAYSVQGLYAKALADYNNALKINPDFANALNNRAWAYFKLGRPDKGIPDVERALTLNPRSAHAYDTRAHIHQSQGDIQSALKDYRRAIRFGGAEIIKLYQCGLQANGVYSGPLSGVETGDFQAALETCVKDKACDPLPEEQECNKLTS